MSWNTFTAIPNVENKYVRVNFPAPVATVGYGPPAQGEPPNAASDWYTPFAAQIYNSNLDPTGYGKYSNRYPMTVEFDFQPRASTTVAAQFAPVDRVELYNIDGTLVETLSAPNLKKTFVLEDSWSWCKGTKQLYPQDSGFGGELQWQSPDNTYAWGSGNYALIYIRQAWAQQNGLYTGGAPANVTVTVTDGLGAKTSLTCEYLFEAPAPQSLCWYWASNPGELTPSVSATFQLTEETPGQWDTPGTVTVTPHWGGLAPYSFGVSSMDLGWVDLGDYERTYTIPMNPPPTETMTVRLEGGNPYGIWESTGTIQFQQDPVGGFLNGNVGCPYINITGTVVCLGGGGGSPDGAEVRVFYEYPVGQPGYLWQEDWCAIGNWVVETSPGVFQYDLTSIAYGCAVNIPSGEPFIIHVRCSSSGPAGINQVAVPGGWPAGPFNLDIDIPLCPLT